MNWSSRFTGAARVALGLVGIAVVVTGVGCSGDKRLTIPGSVTYEGRPVASGMVKIYGPGDRVAMAYFRDGAFRITDVTPGEIAVTVEPDPSEAKPAFIPKKYGSPKTTDLHFTITSSTRELPIELR